MATVVIGDSPAVVAAADSENQLTLDVDREYTIQHLGFDVSGSAVTTAIFGSVAAAVDADYSADYSADTNKTVLQYEKAIVIGPGVKEWRYKTASGAPTFQVLPGPKYLGMR